MKVLSWNVNGRVKNAQRRQIDAVLGHLPDVTALQEVTNASHPVWSESLTAGGYSVLSTIDLLAVPYPDEKIHRKYCNVTAARHQLAQLPGLVYGDAAETASAFPEKHLAARVTLDGVEIDLHNTHLPPGSTRGVIKVKAFEAIRRQLDRDKIRPRIPQCSGLGLACD